MPRLVNRRIAVKAADGRLLAFHWRERWHPVQEVLETWIYTAPWWEGERAPRQFYRLLTPEGLFEVSRTTTPPDEWRLYKIYD